MNNFNVKFLLSVTIEKSFGIISLTIFSFDEMKTEIKYWIKGEKSRKEKSNDIVFQNFPVSPQWAFRPRY